MPETIPILIPREIVNDDFVTIVEWCVAPGAYVERGTPLLEIETSKAIVPIEAPREGHVEIVRQATEEVAIGTEVGRLHAEPVSAGVAPMTSVSSSSADAVSTAGQRVSRKARELIAEWQLDPAAFAHLSIVRRADVMRYLDGGAGEADRRPPADDSNAAEPDTSVSPTVPFPSPRRRKGLFAKARTAADDRGWSLPKLACNYFFRNYLLGLMVRVAPRGVILLLHRLRGVKMGRQCYIDPTALVETAYPENVTMGDGVTIAAHAAIMTHVKAPDYLREHGLVPLVRKKVVLRDHCFVGVNAVIMPGVTVGKGAVVASGAVVVGDVPDHVTVAGNPARVVKHFSIPERLSG